MFPSTPQFINPIKTVGGYLGNVAKEAGQFGSAWKTAWNASSGIGPGADRAAYKANVGQRKAQGQLLGAVLQGRRYDDASGKQITPAAPMGAVGRGEYK
jgi:hypothetical protein